jgi:hypothetical protein
MRAAKSCFASEDGSSPYRSLISNSREAPNGNTCAAIPDVLELSTAENIALAPLVCQRVVQHGKRYAGGPLEVHAYLVDFNGNLLGQYPAYALQTEHNR